DVAEELHVLKRKYSKLENAYKVLEMTKKKRKGQDYTPEQRQMLTEMFHVIRFDLCRLVKFPPPNWQGYSEDPKSACGRIMPKLSWPPGCTNEQKKVIYEDLIMPNMARAMSDTRNKILQNIRGVYYGEL
ncbi:MAG: hypothetical protein ACO3P6_04935, partial [Pelagibacteraceae bacterium]